MPFQQKKTQDLSVPPSSPCAKTVSISVSFKSDCATRFVRGKRTSILVLESIRNRLAECHLESRVIPADDSHTLPLFEEFLQSLQPQGGLRLSLEHRHPITPIFPQPARLWHRRRCPTTHHHSPRHPRSSPTWTLTCQHLCISSSRQRKLHCSDARRSHVFDHCVRRCIDSGGRILGH